MTYKFNCELCSYSTNRLYCYNKHLKTKKHIYNKNKIATAEKTVKTAEKTVKTAGKSVAQLYKKFICEYCGNIYKDNSHKKRHYNICSARKLKEQFQEEKNILASKYEEEKNILKQEKDDLLEELKLIEKEHIDLLKKIANGEIPSNTTINNNTINMYYIINNYKDAYNYEDLIKKPLTNEEIEYININGPTAGCYKIIENRCIKDIELAKRPFHCLDDARSKYMLRVNDNWDIDKKADKILTAAYPKIRLLFPYEYEDTQTQITNVNKLLEMETKGKHKIISELNKKTLLKKNIKKLKDKN